MAGCFGGCLPCVVRPWAYEKNTRRSLYARHHHHVNTRRSLLVILTSPPAFLGPAFSYSLFPQLSILVADGKRKIFTNLDEAREEGERRRELKELIEGPIITSPSGVKYRELSQGSGKVLVQGDMCSIYYTIYKLNNGFYLDSLGYGKEGKNDVGDALTFQYGGGMLVLLVKRLSNSYIERVVGLHTGESQTVERRRATFIAVWRESPFFQQHQGGTIGHFSGFFFSFMLRAYMAVVFPCMYCTHGVLAWIVD